MKKLKIGDKFYELKEVEDTPDAETPDVETPEVVPAEEVPAVETPAVETPAVETPAVETPDTEEKIEKAAEKIVASLGLDKIHSKLDALSATKTVADNKPSALIDLEALMQKDVSEMTVKEKIVGFFQAMIKNNQPVLKALSEGTAADGGYLFPDEFRYEIIRDIADNSHRMRNDVTVVPMKRDIMNIPSLESRPQVTWTEENASKSTTTAHFGQVTLTVKKMAAILYASDELIDDASEIDIVNFIIGLFSEAIGEEEDRVVWRGNGTTEPTGIVVAQAAGTIAGRTCSGNLSIDNMIDLLYDLPAKWQKSAKIYVHRTNIRELRKLKNANNNYYWSEPVAVGLAPTFMGYPVVETNELGEDQIYFGDLKKTYWLGDRQKMTVKISQDTETAFTKDQTAIRVVSRIAGNVVLGASCRALVTLP